MPIGDLIEAASAVADVASVADPPRRRGCRIIYFSVFAIILTVIVLALLFPPG